MRCSTCDSVSLIFIRSCYPTLLITNPTMNPLLMKTSLKRDQGSLTSLAPLHHTPSREIALVLALERVSILGHIAYASVVLECDKTCQNWPIRVYTRSRYTGMAFWQVFPQAFFCFLHAPPRQPLIFFCFRAALQLTERLEKSSGVDYQGGIPLHGLYRYLWSKGYGFSAVLVINRQSILAILIINKVWFLHSSWIGHGFFRVKLLFHQYR